MKIWRDAILFGFAYITIATAMNTWRTLERYLIIAVDTLGLQPKPNAMPIEMIASLRQAPLSTVAATVNEKLPLGAMIYRNIEYNVPSLLLNFGTTLAILYSVRQRKIWPFAAAVTCYALVKLPGQTMFQTQSYLYFLELTRSNENAGYILGGLYDLIGGRLFLIITTLPSVLAALPALALGLYVRKTMAAAEQPPTTHTPTVQGT